jgi:ATP-binding cassette, subfamily B, multidrug efflux pump
VTARAVPPPTLAARRGRPTAWSFLAPYRGRIALGAVMLLVTNLAFLGIPVTMGLAVEALQAGDPAGEVPGLALAMIGFALLTAVTRIVSRVTIFNAARAAEYDLRSLLFGRLLRLDPAYHRAHPTGDVMTRLISDVTTVRALWGVGVLNLVNTAFAFAAVLIMMVRIDPFLTLLAILPYPTIYFLGQFMGRRIYRASRGAQAHLGELANGIQEDLTAIQVIKSYGVEAAQRARFQARSEKLLARNMDLVRVRGQMGPAMAALGSLAVVIVLFAGGHRVIDGRIELGQFVELNGYLARLAWPTLALGWMLSLLERGRASWSRLEGILDALPGIRAAGDDDDQAAPPPGELTGEVELRDLTVELGGRRVLDRVSLHLRPGTVTAIVGRTGAGKSTLVDCLARMIDVPPGTIFLDGHDVTSLSLATVRGAIGYAPQEAFLFSTTIADNIAFGFGAGRAAPGPAPAGPPGDPERVARAADAAGLARDLAALPEGDRTVVGERGITLSGGQRQRVALARALAAEPKVLILDDSLSSVDAETERHILERLAAVMHGRTSILISHRVAAVKDADQIVVLDEGRVVEQGRHHELLARDGLYAELYRTQHEAAGAGAIGGAEVAS